MYIRSPVDLNGKTKVFMRVKHWWCTRSGPSPWIQKLWVHLKPSEYTHVSFAIHQRSPLKIQIRILAENPSLVEANDQIPLPLGRTRISSPAKACVWPLPTLEQPGGEASWSVVDQTSCKWSLLAEALGTRHCYRLSHQSHLALGCQTSAKPQWPFRLITVLRRFTVEKSYFLWGNSCSFLPGEHLATMTHSFSIPASRNCPTVATRQRLGENPCLR